MFHDHVDTPLGRMLLAGDGHALTFIGLPDSRHPLAIPADWQRDPAPFVEARRQFDRYFDGTLQAFDLPLAPRGTAFQLSVWNALKAIPYAHTISYVELARRIGNPNASRAVGLANGANPLSIIVPCHRVIGASGALTGYGGGLPAKRFLLDHEKRQTVQTQFELTA